MDTRKRRKRYKRNYPLGFYIWMVKECILLCTHIYKYINFVTNKKIELGFSLKKRTQDQQFIKDILIPIRYVYRVREIAHV